MGFRDGRSDLALDFYDSREDYLKDLAQAYHDTIQHFYDLGACYVQLDDTTWVFLIPKLNETSGEELDGYRAQAQEIVDTINKALTGLPEDLTLQRISVEGTSSQPTFTKVAMMSLQSTWDNSIMIFSS